MTNSKKLSFSKPPILNIFFPKITGIGPWVRRINWCKGHWCGSTYMVMRLSDISSKTGKKCIFGVFLLHPQENQSKFLGYQGWAEFLMITLVSSQKLPTPNISVPRVTRKLLMFFVFFPLFHRSRTISGCDKYVWWY